MEILDIDIDQKMILFENGSIISMEIDPRDCRLYQIGHNFLCKDHLLITFNISLTVT